MTKIAIVGAGSFGVAIAKLFSSYPGCSVVLWSAVEKEIEAINKKNGVVDCLPGVVLNLEIVNVTTNVEALKYADILVLAVASKYLRNVAKIVLNYIKKDVILVSAAKGLEDGSFKRMSEVVFDETRYENIVALSGPSHAEEIANLIPSTAVVSSLRVELAEKVQAIFNSSVFRIYVNEDIIGVEIGGALKNIIALAVGICDGLGLGDNTKAALITRGLFEIEKFGMAMGAKRRTFAGLSGLGDLIATCISKHSRNKKAGFLIGTGVSVIDALKKVNMTVEGYFATKTVYRFCKFKSLDLPIIENVYKILYEGSNIKNSINILMNRLPKHEF